MNKDKILEKIATLEQEMIQLKSNSEKQIQEYITNINLQMAGLQGKIDGLKEILDLEEEE